jgi:hypothetical protein
MMIFSMFLSFASADDSALEYYNPQRPLRPTTHPGDPNLTSGELENFREIYFEKDAILKMFGAKKGASTSLPIINKTTGWVDVEYKGKKIARLQPLTTAVVHGVPEGEYEVIIHVENMQYSYKETFTSVTINEAMTPGSMDAIRAETPEYKKPGFDDLPAKEGGHLQSFSISEF